ncbi:MAG: alpha/beta hydrolase [Alphaproteobacteria bacterium]|nr:alpha/beta hydrolase [Alphaproteobacteria bacterium]
MAFDNLPEQSQERMGPAAQAYAAEILERSRKVAESSRVVLDQAYGPDYWQRVDLYLPESESLRDLPVLIFLHGGGWSNGYKEWMGYMAPAFTDLPAIFVSVSYRLLPDIRFPANLDDTIAALAWVHKYIAGYGGDPGRLFVGGHSAGGHLAALATLRRDLLAKAGVPIEAIRACLPVSGSFKFEIGELEARGKAMLAKPEDAPVASPITYVAGNRVPFYIVWGDQDLEHVLKTGMPMVDALKAAGSSVEHQVFPGFDHFQISIDGGNPASPWVKKVRAWMAAT